MQAIRRKIWLVVVLLIAAIAISGLFIPEAVLVLWHQPKIILVTAAQLGRMII